MNTGKLIKRQIHMRKAIPKNNGPNEFKHRIFYVGDHVNILGEGIIFGVDFFCCEKDGFHARVSKSLIDGKITEPFSHGRF